MDPDNPGIAVLDRTHYIQPEGPGTNQSSMCDATMGVGKVLVHVAMGVVALAIVGQAIAVTVLTVSDAPL